VSPAAYHLFLTPQAMGITHPSGSSASADSLCNGPQPMVLILRQAAISEGFQLFAAEPGRVFALI
jgi:hypothetical protein